MAELAADCDAGAHYCDDATGLMPPLAAALAQCTAPPFCAGGVLNLPARLSPDLAERLCGVTGLSALLASACGS